MPRLRLLATLACAAGLATACGSDGEPVVVAASTTVAVATSADPPTTAAGTSGASSCSLLDASVIEQVTGAQVDEGTQTLDPDRRTDLCQWQSTDPVAVVAVGLTTEPAQEAFDLNRELAPAYFEGEAVDTTVPGAERAYLVLGDGGQLVIGAVVGDRYVSVQLAGDGLTEDDVRALAATVVERLA